MTGYITLDFRCTVCQLVVEDEFIKKADVEFYTCPLCDGEMKPLPSGTRTDFVFADPGLKR